MGIIPEMQGFFNICKSIIVIHQLANWIKPYDNLNRCNKSFDKVQQPIYDKKKRKLQKMGTEGTYLNTIMTIYDKPIANITVNG